MSPTRHIFILEVILLLKFAKTGYVAVPGPLRGDSISFDQDIKEHTAVREDEGLVDRNNPFGGPPMNEIIRGARQYSNNMINNNANPPGQDGELGYARSFNNYGPGGTDPNPYGYNYPDRNYQGGSGRYYQIQPAFPPQKNNPPIIQGQGNYYQMTNDGPRINDYGGTGSFTQNSPNQQMIPAKDSQQVWPYQYRTNAVKYYTEIPTRPELRNVNDFSIPNVTPIISNETTLDPRIVFKQVIADAINQKKQKQIDEAFNSIFAKNISYFYNKDGGLKSSVPITEEQLRKKFGPRTGNNNNGLHQVQWQPDNLILQPGSQSQNAYSQNLPFQNPSNHFQQNGQPDPTQYPNPLNQNSYAPNQNSYQQDQNIYSLRQTQEGFPPNSQINGSFSPNQEQSSVPINVAAQDKNQHPDVQQRPNSPNADTQQLLPNQNPDVQQRPNSPNADTQQLLPNQHPGLQQDPSSPNADTQQTLPNQNPDVQQRPNQNPDVQQDPNSPNADTQQLLPNQNPDVQQRPNSPNADTQQLLPNQNPDVQQRPSSPNTNTQQSLPNQHPGLQQDPSSPNTNTQQSLPNQHPNVQQDQSSPNTDTQQSLPNKNPHEQQYPNADTQQLLPNQNEEHKQSSISQINQIKTPTEFKSDKPNLQNNNQIGVSVTEEQNSRIFIEVQSTTARDFNADIDYALIPGWYEQDGINSDNATTVTVTEILPNMDANLTIVPDIVTVIPNAPSTQPDRIPFSVQEAKKAMVENHMGYLSGFFYELLLIATRKSSDDSRTLLAGITSTVDELVKSGKLHEMGRVVTAALTQALLQIHGYVVKPVPPQAEAAALMLLNKEEALAQDVVDIINLLDSGYSLERGEELLETIHYVADYTSSGNMTAKEVAKAVLDAMLRPYYLAPAANKARLFGRIETAILKRYQLDGRRINKQTGLENKMYRTNRENEMKRIYSQKNSFERRNKNNNQNNKTGIQIIESDKVNVNFSKADKNSISQFDLKKKSKNANIKSKLGNKNNQNKVKEFNNYYSDFVSHKMKTHVANTKGQEHNLNRRVHRHKHLYSKYNRLKQREYNYENSLRHRYDSHKDFDTKKINYRLHVAVQNSLKELPKPSKTSNVENDDDGYDREIRNTEIQSNELNYRKYKLKTKKQVDVTTTTNNIQVASRKSNANNGITNVSGIKDINSNIFKTTNDSDDTKNIIEITNDDEEQLKMMLSDAIRHSDFILTKTRKSDDTPKERRKLNDVSSYSDDESLLKINIYKTFGYDAGLQRKTYT